jgi:hypothetical protein
MDVDCFQVNSKLMHVTKFSVPLSSFLFKNCVQTVLMWVIF